MADLQDRLNKLAQVEKQEHFRSLILKIRQLRDAIALYTFQVHDEDLKSIKEDQVRTAANELYQVVKEARKLQVELEG